MNHQRPRILVTNDDGIHSPGLTALADAMREVGDVCIIAPDRERSAVSHSFTINHPIRAQSLGHEVYIIDGTPADCVMFGTRGFLDYPLDLVASGINRGPNLGIDTVYSGTVAAAHEGHLCNVPSFAISMDVPRDGYTYHFETGARFAKILARAILSRTMPDGAFLNVNVPNIPWEQLQGVAITRLGQRIYRDKIVRRVDPQGKEYYWIGGEAPTWVKSEGTDFHALEQDKISVTPLGQDFTQFHAIPELDRWNLSLNSE
ncbi:MAG TPA: 5'/3'-nucleotidase SurE [bacterium]|nr:5'/3'-nucleotidase SurE [Candidatus Omnitrophota bacterium]HOJ62095.1 5'/3'-nucleotidase SurE [bacterium]HOL92971.1 5'/3'-nucleotidase SurE [bacterium]HPO99323.1 5'/3'-nucleotidase SurE [bacterium]HXK94940.1 5'/3'-nucleotidase SurE [bacterium]